jgi:hypothetical protein
MTSLLERRLNLFKIKHSTKFSTGLHQLAQNLANQTTLTKGAKNAQITEFIRDWLRKYFFGIQIIGTYDECGINAIYTQYYSRYPEELSDKTLQNIIDAVNNDWVSKESEVVGFIEQKYQMQAFTASVKSLCQSVLWEGINELSNSLQQIYKDEEKRQKQIGELKKEKESEKSERIFCQIITVIIALISIISNITKKDTTVNGSISISNPITISDSSMTKILAFHRLYQSALIDSMITKVVNVSNDTSKNTYLKHINDNQIKTVNIKNKKPAQE